MSTGSRAEWWLPTLQVLQPRVKLRPFFWSKLPQKPDNIWSRVALPPPELQPQHMAALEHLFVQTASPAKSAKKLAPGQPGWRPDGGSAGLSVLGTHCCTLPGVVQCSRLSGPEWLLC